MNSSALSLTERLKLLETQKPIDTIKLGLERTREIAEVLKLLPVKPKVIMVAGTNGKGSTIAVLEQLLLSHGKKVGTYTSPHLFVFNERIKLNGKLVEDKFIIDAFDKLTSIPMSRELTYYEWVTLCALIIFKEYSLDYILLEVGLGGRLDAVNIVDADIGMITSIDYDHMDILGDTLEQIAYEKAGIFRENQTVFCSELLPPSTLIEQSKKLGVDYKQLAQDYYFKSFEDSWTFISKDGVELEKLPLIDLHLNNVSNALACFLSLGIKYSQKSIHQSLLSVNLIGRCQKVKGAYPLMYDVAHNLQSISNLSSVLSKIKTPCLMVFSMLQGKDIDASLKLLAPYVDKWFIAPVLSARSLSIESFEDIFQGEKYKVYSSVTDAFSAAKKEQKKYQTLVVCGSFLTVSEVYQ